MSIFVVGNLHSSCVLLWGSSHRDGSKQQKLNQIGFTMIASSSRRTGKLNYNLAIGTCRHTNKQTIETENSFQMLKRQQATTSKPACFVFLHSIFVLFIA